MRKEGENKLRILSIILILIVGCAPNNGQDDNSSKSMTPEEIEDRDNECALYNSFAAGNMQNRDFASVVENYMYMIENVSSLQTLMD